MKHPTTSPLAFVLHALVALFTGALGAGIGAGAQLIGNGPFSLSVVIMGALTGFTTYFASGFIMLEKNPEAKAALLQTGQAVIARVDELQASHSGLSTQVGQLIGHVRQLATLLNQTPPTAIGQAPAPSSAAAQPAPIQITPNPTFNATAAIPDLAFAQMWNQPAQPQNTLIASTGPASVPQQAFPPLNWTGLTPAVPAQ